MTGPRAPRQCELDPYRAHALERVERARPRCIRATVLLREIAERGYTGGISRLEAFLAPLKEAEPEPVVRFETPRGRQMQADLTVVRRGRGPLLTLVATLRAALREAFDDFGGCPPRC